MECRVCSTFDIKPFYLQHMGDSTKYWPVMARLALPYLAFLPPRYIYCLAWLPLDIFTALPTCQNILPACLTQHVTMHGQSQAVTSHQQSHQQPQHKKSAARPALPAFLLTYLLPCLPAGHIYYLPALPSMSQCMAGHEWSHQQSQHKMLAGHTTQGPGLPCLACLPDIFTALLAFHIFTALLAFLLTYLLPCLSARHIYCLPAFPNMSQCTTGHKHSQVVTSHKWSHWPSQPKTLAGHNHPTLNIYLIILIYIIFFTI